MECGEELAGADRVLIDINRGKEVCKAKILQGVLFTTLAGCIARSEFYG